MTEFAARRIRDLSDAEMLEVVADKVRRGLAYGGGFNSPVASGARAWLRRWADVPPEGDI